jgi:hypothetical protein
VRKRRHGDHARVRVAQQPRQQQPGQHEVAEVVGAELKLEPVTRGRPARRRHHAGVVHQQVYRFLPAFAERAHRCHVRKVELGNFDVDRRTAALDARRGLLGSAHVPAGQHDPGAAAGELFRDMPADP